MVAYIGQKADKSAQFNGLITLPHEPTIADAPGPYWGQIYDAAVANGIDPVAMYFSNPVFFATIAGKIAGWADAWGAHTGTQGTPANRMVYNPATGLVEFVRATPTRIGLDFGTPVASANRTVLCGHDLQTIPVSNQYYIDFQTGRLILVAGHTTADTGFYDGTWYQPGAAATGPQGLLWELIAGTATASVRRDGGQIGAKQDHAAVALGGTVTFGERYAPSATTALDAHVKYLAICTGANPAATAALEVINATMKAAGEFG